MNTQKKLELLRRLKIMMICEKEHQHNLNALGKTFEMLLAGHPQVEEAIDFYEKQIIERLDNIHIAQFGHTMDKEFETKNEMGENEIKTLLKIAEKTENYEEAIKLRDLLKNKIN